jgi:hypothetical protein
MHDFRGTALAQRLMRWEFVMVLAVAWGALISVPLVQSAMTLSWDAVNHHIYLGWMAEHSRLGYDFMAAGYQSYQFPYLYWPAYKLAASGAGPVLAGVVLATLDLIAVPPIWMIARTCMPGDRIADQAMRLLAVLLAFLSPVVLSLLDSSSNDLMAAAPLLWSVAFALESFRPQRSLGHKQLAVLSGALAGVAVACKFSNAPVAVMLPLLWLFCGAGWRERLLNTLIAGLAGALALVATYGVWGVQLWTHFGNPIYPFFDSAFEPLRHWAGWRP